MGAKNARALTPDKSKEEVEDGYAVLREMEAFISLRGRMELSSVEDVRPYFVRCRVGESFLEPPEFLAIKRSAAALLALKASADTDVRKTCPKITGMLEALSDQSALVSEITSVFDDAGVIKDDASSALLSIRRSLKAVMENARASLESMVRDKSVLERLMDDIITIREDRFVLCVRAAWHTQFEGVVHGQSASGQTYFIEPMRVVEANNKVAILKKQERIEEIAILKALTSFAMEFAASLAADLDIAAVIDLLQAKAVFKDYIDGSIPAVSEGGGVRLLKARHPALVFKQKAGAKAVTAVDILIDKGKNVLVISGANTGGKTVALKTLGLLSVMVRAALPIPAASSSEAALFTSVYADIGDRQDIAKDLSTFSAHLKRMGEIMAKVEKSSLVLIDEIGVGTDPAEGSVLALTILEELRDIGAVAVVTTHLNLLKAHAEKDAAFMNASVAFDESSLKPLYELHYGIPGASLGLKVAETYGIPKRIIEGARKKLKGDEGAFIEMVREAAAERDRLAIENARLKKAADEKEKALTRLRDDRKILLEKARKKVEAIVSAVTSEIERIVSEKIRSEASKKDRAAKAAAMDEIETEAKKAAKALGSERVDFIPVVGDTVMVEGVDVPCEVLKVDEGKKTVEARYGNITFKTDFRKLRRAESKGRQKAAAGAASYSVPFTTGAEGSVNVIGMRVEEALKKIEAVLDSAHMQGYSSVEIIHGHGTGALKKAIRAYLKENPCVKGYEEGGSAGSAGAVTIAKLE